MKIGPVTVTRDGALLWLLAAAALIGYLSSAPLPFWDWDYHAWLQFAAAAAGWGIGKLQVSPAPSTGEVARGFRDDGSPIGR